MLFRLLARLLRKWLVRDVYVQVFRNRIWARDVESGTTVELTAREPFTSQRLLVGDFAAAENLLMHVYSELYANRLLTPSPRVLIQPREMSEGGLSPVEIRVLRELAEGAGGRSSLVHQGPVLTDSEVRDLLNSPDDGSV